MFNNRNLVCLLLHIPKREKYVFDPSSLTQIWKWFLVETWLLCSLCTFKIIVFSPYFWTALKITNGVLRVI